MKKMKRVLSMFLCLLLLMSVSGCGNGEESTKTDGDSAVSKGETELVWWTSYSIVNTNLMQTTIDEFNELHEGEYHVTLLFAGGSTELRTKLLTTAENELPALVTGQPIVTAYFDSQEKIAKFQDFVDADEEDWTATTYDAVKKSYSNKDGDLVGWPFGVSCGGWLVNKDLIAEAGYSVDDLTSYEKIVNVASDVAKKNIAEYGIGFYTQGADIYDALTLQGVDFLDNDNGHSAEATASVITEEPTYSVLKKYLTLFTSLYKNGYAYTFGADTNSDIIPAFVQENIAIAGCTNSFVHRMLSYDPSFDWTFIPNTAVDDSGEFAGYAIPEGHGTYIVNTGNEKEMQGAYEVIKFFAEADNQAYWCSNTGYIPYTDEAFNNESYQTWMMENYPDAVKLKDTLLATPENLKVPYTQVPNAVTNACTGLLNHLSQYPDEIDTKIQERHEDMNETIEIYALRRK